VWRAFGVPGKNFLGLILLPCLLIALNTCTLEVEIPEYSLTFQGELIYDPYLADVVITYSFIAEEAYHRCKYSLAKSDGTIVEPEQTVVLAAGEPHQYQKDLSGYEDGVYRFHVVVQAERTPGVYVDLEFLDKEFEFYLDKNPPTSPSITLSEGTYVGDQESSFDHLEWSNPEGSPVDVYYSTDGSDPAAGGVKFDGSPVPIPSSQTPVAIKAVAIDMAGHVGAPEESTISFLKAEAVDPDRADITEGSPVGAHILVITGYGFNSSTSVELFDPDGTKVFSSILPPIENDQIMLTINLNSGTGGTPPGDNVVNAGWGELVIRNQDTPSFPTDYLDFLIE
jgi:hypothetical protein